MMNIESLTSVLVKTTEQETKAIVLSSVIRNALLPFDGKKISKRMETAVQAAFPDAVVHYQPDTFFYKISVWGGSTGRATCNERFTVYFGGYEKNTFSLAEYDEKNACCGTAAIARNAGRARVLARPELLQAVADAANAVRQANAALVASLGAVQGAAQDGEDEYVYGGAIFSINELETAVHNFCGEKL